MVTLARSVVSLGPRLMGGTDRVRSRVRSWFHWCWVSIVESLPTEPTPHLCVLTLSTVGGDRGSLVYMGSGPEPLRRRLSPGCGVVTPASRRALRSLGWRPARGAGGRASVCPRERCGSAPVSQISFIYLAKSTKKTLLALTSVSAVTLLLVCSGAFFPYSSQPASPKPKRVFLQVRRVASPEGLRGEPRGCCAHPRRGTDRACAGLGGRCTRQGRGLTGGLLLRDTRVPEGPARTRQLALFLFTSQKRPHWRRQSRSAAE